MHNKPYFPNVDASKMFIIQRLKPLQAQSGMRVDE